MSHLFSQLLADNTLILIAEMLNNYLLIAGIFLRLLVV